MIVLGIVLFSWLGDLLSVGKGREDVTAGRNSAPPSLSVSKLLIYPIKSCKGVLVKEALITKTGLEWDREWIVAEYDKLTERWVMVTQRDASTTSMVLIEPTVMVSDKGDVSLKIIAPGMPELIVPRTFDSLPVNIDVWDNPCKSNIQSQEASEWFSKFLKKPVALFVKNPSFQRNLPLKHIPSPTWFASPPETAFADGFPFLILSQESVSDFNKQWPVTEMNFRPNILVAGGVQDGKIYWSRLSILHPQNLKSEMTNNDPNTGIANPNGTLKSLMKTRRVDPGAKFEACMGVNAVQIRDGGSIGTGQIVTVLECGTLDKRGIWFGGLVPILRA